MSMSLATRIEDTRKLWNVLLPNVPLPDQHWVDDWLRHSDTFIQHGIKRAVKKFKTPPVEPSEVWKYVSSVIRSEADKREQQQELRVSTLPTTQVMRHMTAAEYSLYAVMREHAQSGTFRHSDDGAAKEFRATTAKAVETARQGLVDKGFWIPVSPNVYRWLSPAEWLEQQQ